MWRSMQIRGLAHGLLVFVFTCLGSLPQLALCTTMAGHHALELRDATCCSPVAVADDTASVRALASGCAPDCSDTPLGVIAAAQRPGHFYGTVTATLCVLAISSVVPLEGERGRRAAQPIPLSDLTLRALRSTVALC